MDSASTSAHILFLLRGSYPPLGMKTRVIAEHLWSAVVWEYELGALWLLSDLAHILTKHLWSCNTMGRHASIHSHNFAPVWGMHYSIKPKILVYVWMSPGCQWHVMLVFHYYMTYDRLGPYTYNISCNHAIQWVDLHPPQYIILLLWMR